MLQERPSASNRRPLGRATGQKVAIARAPTPRPPAPLLSLATPKPGYWRRVPRLARESSASWGCAVTASRATPPTTQAKWRSLRAPMSTRGSTRNYTSSCFTCLSGCFVPAGWMLATVILPTISDSSNPWLPRNRSPLPEAIRQLSGAKGMILSICSTSFARADAPRVEHERNHPVARHLRMFSAAMGGLPNLPKDCLPSIRRAHIRGSRFSRPAARSRLVCPSRCAAGTSAKTAVEINLGCQRTRCGSKDAANRAPDGTH